MYNSNILLRASEMKTMNKWPFGTLSEGRCRKEWMHIQK
jgi:hypothetical protein